jgi:hypothetical protein
MELFTFFITLLQINFSLGEDQLWLSHALIHEAKILANQQQMVYSLYIDVHLPFSYLDELETHTNSLLSQVTADHDKLRQSHQWYMFLYEGKYYSYLRRTTTDIAERACLLGGMKDLQFTTKDQFDGFAVQLAAFNAANNGSSVPIINTFLIPLKADSGQLQYIHSGVKVNLGEDAADLRRAETIAPRYNVEDQTITFPTTDDPTFIVCEFALSDKLKFKSTWVTHLARAKVALTHLQEDIAYAKTHITNLINIGSAFTYQSGLKVRIDTLPTHHHLAEYSGTLATYTIDKIEDQSTYAMAQIFLTRYIATIQDMLEDITNAYVSKEQLAHAIAQKAISQISQRIIPQLQGTSEAELFMSAVQQSIQSEAMYYDPINHILLSQLSCYNPTIADMWTLYTIKPLPMKSDNYEILLNIPSQQFIVDYSHKFCDFVEDTYLITQCMKIKDSDNAHLCNSADFGNKNECCTKITNQETEAALNSCGSIIYTEAPDLFRINYRKINYILTSSITQSHTLSVLCDGDKQEHTINESTAISTACDISFEGESFKTDARDDIHVTSIQTVSSIFSAVRDIIQNLDTSPTYPVSTHQFNLPELEQDILDQISNLTFLEWTGLSSTGALLAAGIAVSLFVCLRRCKHRQRRQIEKARAEIMSNYTAPPYAQTMPIYKQQSKATAPHVIEFL